ncbi:MAG: hypothetical protein HYY50_02430 [Candidatus Kerfeldbacteria bacterium]|nr:hypothetical protein [Candidatus Kerfeldbacteria bacterium]
MFLRWHNVWGPTLRELNRWIYVVSVTLYLGLFLVEDLEPGFVSLHFKLNLPLWIAMLSGAVLIFAAEQHRPQERTRSKWRWVWSAVVAIGSGLLVWFRIRHLGGLAIIISILATLVVIALAAALDADRDQHEPTRSSG